MIQVISNNQDQITASITAYQSFISAETELGQKKQVFSVGMAKLFTPRMKYEEYVATSAAWRAEYMTIRNANEDTAQRAVTRAIVIMNEYLTLIAAETFVAPKSQKPEAIKKAEQRKAGKKVSPALAAATALLEKAKAAEKAVQAELKIQRGGVIKEVKKATKAQLDKIEEILNLTPARQLGIATATKESAAKKPAAKKPAAK